MRSIAAISLSTRKIRPIVTGTWPRYLDGLLFYSYAGVVSRVPFDPDRFEMSGRPTAVLEDVFYWNGNGYTGFDIARTGSIIYIPGAHYVPEGELVWLDRSGRATPAVPGRQAYGYSALSPDGRRIVASIWSSADHSDLWIHDLARNTWSRLTYGKGAGNTIWSPDGRSIIASLGDHIYRIAADGSGEPEHLVSDVEATPGDVSPDGKILAFHRATQPGQCDIFTLRLDVKEKPKTLLASDVWEGFPAFSPDGRWMAYQSLETGRWEVHVRPFPGPGPRVTVSTDGGFRAAWSRDGRELFFTRGREVWVVPVSARESFSAGTPRRLFAADLLGSEERYSFLNVSADGKRFLATITGPEVQKERRLVFVADWLETLDDARQ